jgi:hypothetical protein
MTEKMAEIEERALARLMVPDALMPGQYYEGVHRRAFDRPRPGQYAATRSRKAGVADDSDESGR